MAVPLCCPKSKVLLSLLFLGLRTISWPPFATAMVSDAGTQCCCTKGRVDRRVLNEIAWARLKGAFDQPGPMP